MLSNRCKEIIYQLLNEETFVTINQISEQLGVSSRTVLRTMDEVSDWFSTNDVEFQKKKGKGLRVYATRSDKQALLAMLKGEKADVVYSPEERKVVIKAKLLTDQEPMKLYVLAKILDVTESTISNDLVFIEPWLESFNLELIKRPGLGIYIVGDEMAIRKAIVALIYEHFQLQGLLSLVIKNKGQTESYVELEKNLDKFVLGLIELEAFDEIHKLLTALESTIGYHFADQGYIALLIRISLTIRRAFGKEQAYESKDRVFLAMKTYIDQKGVYLKQLSDYEVNQLVRFIKGTKQANQEGERISMVKDFRMIQLAKELISEMESHTGIYLSDNPELLTGLVRHLGPAIYRMKNGLDIINPLMDEIKSTYPKLFRAMKLSSKVIEEKEKVHIPDDEIAYLSTHVGAIIRKSDRERIKKYQVAVACTYGIGASQLLLTNLKGTFRDIDIVEVVSVFDKGVNNLEKSHIDLIIATVPIPSSHIPTVVIHPLLKEQDIADIYHALENIQPTVGPGKIKSRKPLKEKLVTLNRHSEVILKVLESFSVDKVSLKDMSQVITYASSLLAVNPREETLLEKAFIQREEKGSTILGKKGVMLLHCRADIKQEVSMKVIQLNHPIEIKGNDTAISSVVIMVGPIAYNPAIIEVMSAISRSIIAGDFIGSILSGSKEEVYGQLSQVLDDYVVGLMKD